MRVLALLKKMREDVDVQIADEKEKQEQLAVEIELQGWSVRVCNMLNSMNWKFWR